jgi:Uma2 family endonuclease
MNAPLRKPWTQEEFFSWAERQDTRYEFDGFQPVAMTGGSLNHDRITGSLQVALRTRLRGNPCEPFGPNAGVKTINKAVRYPDALVTCSKVDGKSRLVPGVVVIFEVVSPSSGQEDRILKVREYAAVPSIQRYIIVESTSIGLMVLERQSPDQPWKTDTLTAEGTLHLPEINIEIPVAEIYDGIDFTEKNNQEA